MVVRRYSPVMATERPPSRDELQLLMQQQLQCLHELRGPHLDAQLRLQRRRVKAFQAQRLATTHAGLLASPRHGPAARFFLDDLYGAKDHLQRDEDVARVLPKLLKILPSAAVLTLVEALRMDALSESLDADLANCLAGRGLLRRDGDVGMEAYVAAYRACGRRADRQEQLALVERIGLSLDHLTRLPMLATTLRLMTGPAHRAGLTELHGFLQRGFLAFAHMKGAHDFLQQIVQEERALMVSWLQPLP